jgi:hypothetical protein
MALSVLLCIGLLVSCVYVHHRALTGLMTISWSASFTYLEMSRYWKTQ